MFRIDILIEFIPPGGNQPLEWIPRVDDFYVGHFVDPFRIGEIGWVRLRDVSFSVPAA